MPRIHPVPEPIAVLPPLSWDPSQVASYLRASPLQRNLGGIAVGVLGASLGDWRHNPTKVDHMLAMATDPGLRRVLVTWAEAWGLPPAAPAWLLQGIQDPTRQMAIFSSSAPDQQDAMLAQWQGRQFKSELAAVLCRYSTHPLVAAAIAAGRLDPNAPVPAEATGLIDTLEGRRPVSDMTVRQLLAIGAQALAQGAVADAEHVVAVELLEENAHAGSSVGTLAALKLCTTRDGQQVVAMMGDPSDPWWGYLLARITCVLDDPLDSPLTEQILASPPAAGACLFHPAVDPLAMLPHVQTPELGDMLLLRALATDDPALRAELALSCLGHASPRMATWALQALTGGARPQA